MLNWATPGSTLQRLCVIVQDMRAYSIASDIIIGYSLKLNRRKCCHILKLRISRDLSTAASVEKLGLNENCLLPGHAPMELSEELHERQKVGSHPYRTSRPILYTAKQLVRSQLAEVRYSVWCDVQRMSSKIANLNSYQNESPVPLYTAAWA